MPSYVCIFIGSHFMRTKIYITNYRREIFSTMFAIFSQFFRNWNCFHLYWKNFGLTRKISKAPVVNYVDNYLIYHTQVCFQIVHFLPDKPLILNFDSWLITSRREVSDKLSTIVVYVLLLLNFYLYFHYVHILCFFAESTTVIRGCGNLRLLRKTLA